MKAWMRVLSVSFTSKKLKKKIVFGENYLQGKEDVSINVNIHKYMSSLKDNATIRITNLTYGEIVRLIQGEYYSVEVKAGYRDGNIMTVFKGGVTYISNSLDDRHATTAIISCASDLVAKYSQARINLTVNSGINLYSALNYVCKMSGIPNSNVSPQLKKTFVQDVMNINQTGANFFDTLTKQNNSFIINSDSSEGSALSLYDGRFSNGKVVNMTSSNFLLIGGHPQLSEEGLSISLMPTYSFVCGDTIRIDNSIINIQNEGSSTTGYYLDKDGLYTIFEIQYSLANRSSAFSINMKCKAHSLIKNIVGV